MGRVIVVVLKVGLGMALLWLATRGPGWAGALLSLSAAALFLCAANTASALRRRQ